MIKLVIFDWNGTLIADTNAIVKTSNLIFEKLKRDKIDVKFLREKFILPLPLFYQILGADEGLSKELAHKHAAIFYSNYEGFITGVRTRSGARELMSYLKNKKIKTAIFSNHVYDKIEFQLKRLNLDSYADFVVANESGFANTKGTNKKQKVEKFLKEGKIDSERVLIIGDSLEEIEIGKALGIKSIAITGGNYSTKRLREAGPDYLIHNLKQVIKIIEEFEGGKV